MKLIYLTKVFFILFLSLSFSIYAQDIKEKATTKDTVNEYGDYTSIKISMLRPIPVGNNFATEALDFKYGYNLDLNYYFPFDLMIGFKYQFMRAVPASINLIGDYDRSNINTHALNLGYRFQIKKIFYLEPVFTIGYTSYNNKKNYSGNYGGRISFRDEATTIMFSTSISYHVYKNTSVFFQPDYRIDFMNLETARERQDFFNRATYLNLQIGLRFNFD